MNAEVLATADQVAAATGGKVLAGNPATACTAVSTDSRLLSKGSLFVALKGERFDGTRFCQAAVQGGARIVLVERTAYQQGRLGDIGSAAVVGVDDTLCALGDLAAWHRARFAVRVVGITGSNGKTSTKEMTASVLGGPPHVLANPGNFNNLVGMPRALLGLTPRHGHAVMEMGMNTPGEISRLAEIARPQLGVITNVHPVHLEGLGSVDAVARAKGELLEALPEDGAAVLNADDPYVLKQAERTRARRTSFGRGPSVDVRVLAARHRGEGLEVELSIRGEVASFCLARPGLHNAMNAAAAAAVGLVEGVPAAVVARRLEQAPLPAMRMERHRLGGGVLLVDCYNANPRSVQEALQTLMDLADGSAGRFAVLGDMRELGESTGELHWQTGRNAAEMGLAGLCAFGELARAMAVGAREGGIADVVETGSVAEAIAWATERISRGGSLLIKGSRAMRMERIVVGLARAFGVEWSPGDSEE